MKPSLYIGHGITHADPVFVEEMRLFRERLRHEYDLLEYVGLVHGSAENVYATDAYNVLTCDVFVADCTYPAIGVGIELQIAAHAGKPTLVLHRSDVRLSRMVLGLPNERQEIYAYETLEEATWIVREFTAKHMKGNGTKRA